MLIKQDLEEIGQEIEKAVAQVVRTISKTLGNYATKEDFKTLKKLEDIHRKELAAYA